MRHIKLAWLLVAVALLCGCAVYAPQQLYALPKRSQAYNNLQAAMDAAMGTLEYSAPVAGENQQTVQMADLDGDGALEFLVFAKGEAEYPLQILCFHASGNGYFLQYTLGFPGTAFDQVAYAQLDGCGGMELVVGCQVSDQAMREAYVYTFSEGFPSLLADTAYAEYLCTDLNSDGAEEVFLLRPGTEGTDTARLLAMEGGVLQEMRTAETSFSVDRVKRILSGSLSDGSQAVFVAGALEDGGLFTDVFVLNGDEFTNITRKADSESSQTTLRGYPVYADDIDEDGVMELPDLIQGALRLEDPEAGQYMIRWYALDSHGGQTDKRYTFHDFTAGWYLELDSSQAEQMTVRREDIGWVFYGRDAGQPGWSKVMTIFAFTGDTREEQAVQENRFVLLRTEDVTYAAYLEVASAALHMTREDLINGFQLIGKAWKTGET
ncbi:MAG TPA: hypothetical protein IAC31_10445 [Candidatus Faecousia intestinigallinarum]|nr:hypothetical protein [Candidatus Faecousia intestinigallinarum]